MRKKLNFTDHQSYMYSSADRTMDRNQLFARRVGCWGTRGKFKRLDLGPLWSADTEKLVECKMVIWFHSKGDDVGGYFFKRFFLITNMKALNELFKHNNNACSVALKWSSSVSFLSTFEPSLNCI